MNTQSIKIHGTKYLAMIPTEIINDVKTKHPNKDISVCFSLEADLSTLKNNESVCYGDGESFYFVLTDKYK